MRWNSESGVLIVMFQSQGAGDDLAPGIGFAFCLLVAGFESSELGVELLAFFAEGFEAIGGRFAGHRSSCHGYVETDVGTG